MPKKHPSEVRDRSVRMVVDRPENLSVAYRDLAPKPNVGTETLRKWVMVAQADAGVDSGPTTVQFDEIKALTRKLEDLEETNENLNVASNAFARELNPQLLTLLRGGRISHICEYGGPFPPSPSPELAKQKKGGTGGPSLDST